MIIYPAIDIKEGKCVRLLQGRASDETVFSKDPVETARSWERKGAQFLHVIDLDGAFDGQSPNEGILRRIIKAVSIPVQLGGGIRSLDKVKRYLDDFGAHRIILGTAAVENQALIKKAADMYGYRIAAGIDARQGKAAIKGWVQDTDCPAVDLALRMKELGIDTVIYTDISKDGMMSGPNLKETEKMIRRTGMNIIASGGICRLEDLVEVKKIGAAGAIVGRAFYIGAIQLSDALLI
jgi:phosphoribosylformimino-5-aminoimidazole carboxamide ribotide isomerase